MDARTYRASRSTYATSGALALTAAMLWGLAVWRFGAPWQPLLVPVVAFAAIAAWLSRFRLTFGTSEVALSAPFRTRRRFVLRDVLSIELGSESGLRVPPFVLCIRTSGGDELQLDARVFSPEAVRRLLALAPPAPGTATRFQPRPSKRPR